MKTVEYIHATVATLANGAIDERIQVAIREVVANIADLNTDPKAKRSITMKIEITMAKIGASHAI